MLLYVLWGSAVLWRDTINGEDSFFVEFISSFWDLCWLWYFFLRIYFDGALLNAHVFSKINIDQISFTQKDDLSMLVSDLELLYFRYFLSCQLSQRLIVRLSLITFFGFRWIIPVRQGDHILAALFVFVTYLNIEVIQVLFCLLINLALSRLKLFHLLRAILIDSTCIWNLILFVNWLVESDVNFWVWFDRSCHLSQTEVFVDHLVLMPNTVLKLIG